MSELWKGIEGHPGYEISNLGRIRTVTREVAIGCGATRLQVGQVLRPWIAKNTGYLQVQLTGRVRKLVHRLVAEAFCEGHAEGFEVNHKDGDRTNNAAVNLEWVTRGENAAHSYRCLGRTNPFHGKRGSQHPTSKPVVRIDPATGDKVRYECGSDARAEGFTSWGISSACRGKSATHKGYRWEYA